MIKICEKKLNKSELKKKFRTCRLSRDTLSIDDIIICLYTLYYSTYVDDEILWMNRNRLHFGQKYSNQVQDINLREFYFELSLYLRDMNVISPKFVFVRYLVINIVLDFKSGDIISKNRDVSYIPLHNFRKSLCAVWDLMNINTEFTTFSKIRPWKTTQNFKYMTFRDGYRS